MRQNGFILGSVYYGERLTPEPRPLPSISVAATRNVDPV